MGVTLAFVVRGARARLARAAGGRRAVRLGRLARHAEAGRDDRAARGLRRIAWPRAPGGWPSRSIPKARASSTRSSAWSCPPTRRARSRACRSATRRPRAAAATTTRGPTPQYAPTLRPPRHRRTSPPSPRAASTSPRVGDSLVMCRFTSERGFGLFVGEPYAAMVRAVTGWDVTVEELERVGERIINLERLFNVREGVRRAPGRAAVEGDARADPRRARRPGMYCPPDGARRDARRVLRAARLGRRRRAHGRPTRRPRTLIAVSPANCPPWYSERRGLEGNPCLHLCTEPSSPHSC